MLHAREKRHAHHTSLHEGKEAHLKKEIPDYLKHVIDIDGDGHIDAEELALAHELADVRAEDIDGDGHVSEMEHQVAREIAGKRIMAKRFVDKANKGKDMWKYASVLKEFGEKTPDESAELIATHESYGFLMKTLKSQEMLKRCSGSDLMMNSLKSPITGKQEHLAYRLLNIIKSKPELEPHDSAGAELMLTTFCCFQVERCRLARHSIWTGPYTQGLESVGYHCSSIYCSPQALTWLNFPAGVHEVKITKYL